MIKIDNNWLKSVLLLLAIAPLVACAESDDKAASATSQSQSHAASTDATTGKAFVEDIHYAELFNPIPTNVAPGKIEVVELFWYGCPHCYELEPELNKWKSSLPEDVEMVRIPGVFKDRSGKPNPGWELMARAYYALEALGKADELHEKIFAAIHEQGRNLGSIDALARFVASQGVDEQKFREAMNSLAVQTKTQKAIELTEKYQITGVPSLLVNGRYRVLNRSLNGYGEIFEVVDFLVEKERSRQKNAS